MLSRQVRQIINLYFLFLIVWPCLNSSALCLPSRWLLSLLHMSGPCFFMDEITHLSSSGLFQLRVILKTQGISVVMGCARGGWGMSDLYIPFFWVVFWSSVRCLQVLITLTSMWRHLSVCLGKYLMVALERGGILEPGAERSLDGSQPLRAWHWTLLWQTAISKHAKPRFF